MRKAIIVLALLIVLCATATITEAANYIMHDLGDFGGSLAKVWFINNNGQAIITTSHPGVMQYYFWENGHATEITGITPVGLNNNGQVIGNIDFDEFGYWQNGVVTTFGPQPRCTYGANDHLQFIGGEWGNTAHPGSSFILDNGSFTYLGSDAEVVTINNNGDVAGASAKRACIWQDGVKTDLGALSQVWSRADDINESGQVIGEYKLSSTGDPKRFTWQNGVYSLINDYGHGVALADINNKGQIVGTATMPGSNVINHATLWDNNGSIINLGGLAQQSWAWTINDSGWIGGCTTTVGGQMHALLWEPVPEPSSILALLSGLGGLGLAARRRR